MKSAVKSPNISHTFRKPLSKKEISSFQKTIWNYYHAHKRQFAWRETHDPYHILVSEIMLQQTQTSRVAQKYESFLSKFPTVEALAWASLPQVLLEWQALGYNRRALYLKKTAEAVVKQYHGVFPRSKEALLSLPGIGQSTAGALMNFSFSEPTPFIETNIRTVFLYFFFKEISSVSDIHILELVEQTLDRSHPRDWFYALYDYGTMLKSQNHSLRTLHQKSAHYRKQSKFEGSNRQVRSMILKTLLASSSKRLSSQQIQSKINKELDTIEKNLISMEKEGLVQKQKKVWILA